MTNLIGQSLGRYHLREQLGEGGMATVYKAYDTRLERDVAIKIIRAGVFSQTMLENVLKRFEREAKALAKLSHPHIVKVMDYGEHEGSPYLVMEYLPGGTLKQRVGKPMPWREAVRLALPVAQALEYAHAHNIIHRDIKPANVLMTENNQPMLTDFGIAKILESNDALTGTGVGIGTPDYMAPEQWTGETSKQSDIYSLGVVLYELITGRKPYVADTPVAIMLKQVNDPLPSPKTVIPDLPDEMENVLLKALAKKPEDRFADFETFRSRLENLLQAPREGPVAAAPQPAVVTQKMPAARPPIPAAPASAPQPRIDPHQMPAARPTPTTPPPQPFVATQRMPAARPTPTTPPPAPAPQPYLATQRMPAVHPPAPQAYPDYEPPAPAKNRSFLMIGIVGAVIVALICIVVVAGFVIQSQLAQQAEQTAVAANATATNVARLATETETVRLATQSAVLATQSEVARIQTATEAAKLSTAQAKESTAAAFAQIATATAQAQLEFLGGIQAEMTLVFGPINGSLTHNANDTSIAESDANVNLKNFAVEATFTNPYSTSVGTWDYGFLFRNDGGNNQYRLVIFSSKEWRVINSVGTPNGAVINEGTVSGLSTGAGGTNTVRLVCFGSQGFLYVNNVLISELDLSARSNSGDITIATGLYAGDEINGYATGYDNFTIWSLR